MSTRRYLIQAALLCHDIRLNTHIQITVDLDHDPDLREAERLLWPVADHEVSKRMCDGCPYDIYGIEVEQIHG